MTKIGTIIDNKYELLTLIGEGGMSYVYLAMDIRLNKQWAVKEIKKIGEGSDRIVINSIIKETNLLKKLDHPMLPRIVDIINHNDSLYIVMDYIEGETLNVLLEKNGAQPEGEVIEWAKKLCDALLYLHSQNPPIIYRDMKPANIILKPDGNIKLIDFGIAREYKSGDISDTTALGTIGYAAPEQFGGQTDQRTDIYNLGATLYHLLTGISPCEPPYVLYPIRSVKPDLSLGIEGIILKCTQPDPRNRYRSCAELMYALEHYMYYHCERREKWYIQILKLLFKNRQKVNRHTENHIEKSDIRNARYMAKNIAEIHNDDTNHLTLKGPYRDE